MKNLWILLFIFSFGMMYSFQFYKTSYDIMFDKLSIERSNEILNFFDEGMSKGDNAVNNMERKLGYDMALSAMKRIGELKITSAKLRLKDTINKFNPTTFGKKGQFSYDTKTLFNIAIWALGRMGDENDIRFIVNFIDPFVKNEDFYADTLFFYIVTLGEANNSQTALNVLYDLLKRLKSEKLMTEVVNSIVKHNKLLSIARLIDCKEIRSGNFSPQFVKFINKAIEKLANEGK